jgi:hypothetical protein
VAGVRSLVQPGGPFIGRRGLERGGQYGHGLGFPTPFRCHSGSSAVWAGSAALR